MHRSRHWPIAVRALNLANPLTPLTGLSRYSRVRIYVSSGTRLLGSMDLWTDGADSVSVERLRDALAGRFAHEVFEEQLRKSLIPTQMPEAGARPLTVSVVVATCNRPDDLRRCLAMLVAQRTRHAVEVVVVDNAPESGRARRVVMEFPTVRIVDEPRRGLSYARNAGIVQASGEIVVTTDDDVTVPEDWIERLVAPFARPAIMAVTGNVLPIELETEAQCLFEVYGGLGRGFRPREADGEWFRRRRLAVPTWELGATANAAFRLALFKDPAIGLLDEVLGPGTPTGVSEDTYLFYRILKAGHTIAYEPSAFVWHRHRQTMTDLRAQLYAYSKGHVAYHLTTWLVDGDRRGLLRLFYSLPRAYAARAWHRLRGHSEYPLSLLALEIMGNLAGPYGLWQSRRRVAKLGRSARFPTAVSVTSQTAEHGHALSMEGQISKGPTP